MTTADETATRRAGRLAGALFLATFATSLAAYALFQPVLDDPAGYIAGSGHDGLVSLGALLELLLIAANIGTAVVLYPVLRRHGEALSLGFVTARIVESAFIGVGIVAVLGVVSLRGDDPAAGSLAVSLAQLKDWTFLLGPGLVVPIGNGLILGWLMYRSRLVPRSMALLGLAGGPLLFASSAGVLFGLFEMGGVATSLAVLPEFVWELSLGVYLTARGGRRARAPRAGTAIGAPAQPAA
jgi:hypothetical protein